MQTGDMATAFEYISRKLQDPAALPTPVEQAYFEAFLKKLEETCGPLPPSVDGGKLLAPCTSEAIQALLEDTSPASLMPSFFTWYMVSQSIRHHQCDRYGVEDFLNERAVHGPPLAIHQAYWVSVIIGEMTAKETLIYDKSGEEVGLGNILAAVLQAVFPAGFLQTSAQAPPHWPDVVEALNGKRRFLEPPVPGTRTSLEAIVAEHQKRDVLFPRNQGVTFGQRTVHFINHQLGRDLDAYLATQDGWADHSRYVLLLSYVRPYAPTNAQWLAQLLVLPAFVAGDCKWLAKTRNALMSSTKYVAKCAKMASIICAAGYLYKCPFKEVAWQLCRFMASCEDYGKLVSDPEVARAWMRDSQAFADLYAARTGTPRWAVEKMRVVHFLHIIVRLMPALRAKLAFVLAPTARRQLHEYQQRTFIRGSDEEREARRRRLVKGKDKLRRDRLRESWNYAEKSHFMRALRAEYNRRHYDERMQARIAPVPEPPVPELLVPEFMVPEIDPVNAELEVLAGAVADMVVSGSGLSMEVPNHLRYGSLAGTYASSYSAAPFSFAGAGGPFRGF